MVLKLTGVIDWSWWWILSPIWIPAAAVLALIVVVIVLALVKTLTAETQRNLNAAARSSSIDAEAARYGLQRRQGESNAELKKRIAFMRQAERRARNHEE